MQAVYCHAGVMLMQHRVSLGRSITRGQREFAICIERTSELIEQVKKPWLNRINVSGTKIPERFVNFGEGIPDVFSFDPIVDAVQLFARVRTVEGQCANVELFQTNQRRRGKNRRSQT